MTNIILLVIILGVAFFVLRNIYVSEDSGLKRSNYKYNKKQYLLTKAEKELFMTLKDILGATCHIFPQVHLDAFLFHNINGQNWKAALSHIQRKSVDFLICDIENLKPLLAIEFDDRSHEREDRIERDVVVESILSSAGMPLLRIKNTGYINKEEVRNLISEKIK